jgi:long-subunit acyl-CoA synthetase (AMP-forming)
MEAARKAGVRRAAAGLRPGGTGGRFHPDGRRRRPQQRARYRTAQADDVALILHTSGTTSRPKIVPLLQSNVAASAQNIASLR